MGYRPLGECIESVIDHRGLTPKKLGGDWSQFGYRALSAKNVKNGALVQEDAMNRVSNEMYHRWMPEEVERGDVFITSEAPFGEVLYWDSDEKLVLSQRVFGLKVNRDICDSRYLYYWMQSPFFQGELRGRATGTTVVGLRQPELLRCTVKLPARDIQTAIAHVLGAIDSKITLNKQINGYLEDAMQTLYHNVFANDNSRTVGSIYDIAEVVYGAAFKSTLFNEGGDGFPLIRIRDLSTFKPQCYTTEENPKRTIINPGDVIAGMDAEFRPTFWLGDRALLNQRVCYFKPPENSCITPSYLLCALKPLLAFIQNYATGTTVAHLGKTDLEALDVPMPDEERLSQFTMNAEPMRLMIVSNAQENRRLEALRDSLLPRLMSGEIDVSKVDLTQLNSHLSGC